MNKKTILGLMACALALSMPASVIAADDNDCLTNKYMMSEVNTNLRDATARYGTGKVLAPEFEGTYEITDYFDAPDTIINDWGLYPVNNISNLNPDWEAYQMENFFYIYEDHRIVQDGPGYIFINEDPHVTLYGKEIGSPFIMLESTLVSNGWKLEYIANEVKMKKPGGQLHKLQPYWYKKDVWSKDTYLLVYADEEENIVFWYMTNEGMATQDEAVLQRYLHYEVIDPSH